jgi:hypothetical protein
LRGSVHVAPLGLELLLRDAHGGFKRVGLSLRELSERATIERNICELEAVNKTRIRQIVLSHGGIDLLSPQVSTQRGKKKTSTMCIFFCLIFLKFTEIHAFSACGQRKRVATLSSHAAWTQHSLQKKKIVFEKKSKGKNCFLKNYNFLLCHESLQGV